MSDSRAPRWMRCLAQGEARVRPVDPAALRYGVYPGGDRRRRPVAKVDARPVAQARAAGWIEPEGDGFVLTEEGRQLVLYPTSVGDPAARHRDLRAVPVMVEGQIETAIRNFNESPLARWMKPAGKGEAAFLTDAEFAAGNGFAPIITARTLASRVTSNWSAQPSSGGRMPRDPADAPVSALAAKDRVFRALDTLGPGLDRVVMAVCIREDSLDRLERSEAWPARSGKLALKLALAQLARHYGIAHDAQGGQSARAASASA